MHKAADLCMNSGNNLKKTKTGTVLTIGREEIVRAEAARKQQETLSDPEFGPWLAQASILVNDDEPGMRNFLVRTLGPRCKRIEEAADTEEAERKLDANYFDVVILDNVMPGMHGVDWLAKQRAIGFFANAILM